MSALSQAELAAINEIPGSAMFAGARHSTQTAADLQALRSLTFLPDKHQGVWIPREYVTLCKGDKLCAMVLAHIVYWYQRGADNQPKLTEFRKGVFWLAKSSVDWDNDLGFSESEMRRCLGRLKDDLHLIDTAVMRFRKYGAKKTHVRLLIAEGAAFLRGRPDFGVQHVYPSLATDANHSHPSSATDGHPSVATDVNKKTTSKTTKKSKELKDSANEKNPSFAHPVSGGSSNEATGKGSKGLTPVNTTPDTQVQTPANPEPTPWPKHMKNRQLSVIAQWKFDRTVWPVEFPEISAEDCANLHALEALLVEAGCDLYHAVQNACFNWDVLIARSGVAGDCPPYPETAWALANADAVIKLLHDRLNHTGPMRLLPIEPVDAPAASVEPEAPVTAPEPVTHVIDPAAPSEMQLMLDQAKAEADAYLWSVAQEKKAAAAKAKKAAGKVHA